MLKISSSILATVVAACVFSACSPKFDWRDYRSPDAPFTALFPGKPSTLTRTIDLDGIQVSMTMTATEVDDTTFAIGSAEVPDAAKAQAALVAMETALIRNIGGTVKNEKASSAASATGSSLRQESSIDIEATGSRNGSPMLLVGRCVAQDKRIYQIIVLGREKHIVRDSVDTFISSFKLH